MASPIDPAYDYVAVTPSDTEDLKFNGRPCRCRGIFVGGAGTLTVKDTLGNSVLFTGCLGGAVYQISTDRIMNTGTSATNIVALF